MYPSWYQDLESNSDLDTSELVKVIYESYQQNKET